MTTPAETIDAILGDLPEPTVPDYGMAPLTLRVFAPHVHFGDWARFWGKVAVTAGCWTWTGASRAGYGAFKLDGTVHGTHRLVVEWTRGRIAAGKVIDHLCGNRLCVRPDHLDVTTQRENVLRGSAPHFDQAVA